MQAARLLHTGSVSLLTHAVTDPSKLQGDPSAGGPYSLSVLTVHAHLTGHGISPKPLSVAPPHPTPARHPLPQAMVSSSSDARLRQESRSAARRPINDPDYSAFCWRRPLPGLLRRPHRPPSRPPAAPARASRRASRRGRSAPGLATLQPRRPRRPSLTGPRLGLSGPSGRPLLGALQERGRGPGRRDWSARELLAARTASCLSCHLRTPALGPRSRTSARPGRK